MVNFVQLVQVWNNEGQISQHIIKNAQHASTCNFCIDLRVGTVDALYGGNVDS